MRRILVTGGCGFIGHHIVEHIYKNTDDEVIVFDRLSYASNGFDRLRDTGVNGRVNVFSADFTKEIPEGIIKELGNIDIILHLGAETHVDNSIIDPMRFIESNVMGTAHMLNYARKIDGLKYFIYFSTDEVFGPAPDGVRYKEWDRYNSGNPYSASKAGAEEIVLAYGNTYKLPVMITHCMNAYGERQHPEKFIPLVIKNVLEQSKVYIHSNTEMTKSGSRFYIHCRNIADATLFLIDNGEKQDKYNIVGEEEVSNYDLAKTIADMMAMPLNYEFIDFHSSRPGHDLRYALDGRKLEHMGWKPPRLFHESLEKTVTWYLNNKKWLYI